MTCSNLPTPSLTAQWFHAIDSPILDPIAIRKEKREKKPPKPRTPSKKWILFSKRDNLALERAYKNELDKMNNNNTIVPVNEDYLFQVNLLKREISPIYWEGPVFEVRRATWFMQVDGVWLPCEETLAYQIEEGYQKHKPYQCIIDNDSNNHNHETTAELDLGETTKEKVSQLIMTEELQQTTVIEEEEGEGEKRETLVDPYTNQYIIYNNAYQAWLVQDETTTISKNFFIKLTVKNNVKISLVRGYDQVLKKEENDKKSKEGKEKNVKLSDKEEEEEVELRREPSPIEEEKKISKQAAEDYENEESEEEMRTINQLVLVIHGIGQQMSERLTGQNFVHDVNILRKTIKSAWPSSISTKENIKNGIQVLPIVWRKNILFGVEEEEINKESESDIGVMLDDIIDEGGCPTLEEITLDGAPNIRNLVADVFLDIPLYMTSKYHDLMIQVVTKEINRVYNTFIQRNPNFIKNNGQVSILAHSLGSLLGFDILCAQPFNLNTITTSCSLDFPVKNFFAIGSPLGMILLLRGNKIISRHTTHKPENDKKSLTFVYPAADNIYNIFHKSDPVAYRLEPLIVRHYGAQLKPVPIPYIKGGLKRVLNAGNELANKAGAVLESIRLDLFQKSAMLMRGLSLGGGGGKQEVNESSRMLLLDERRSLTDPNMIKARSLAKGAAQLKTLNSTGRVDYYLQEGILENAYLSALSVHMSYWQDIDVAGFLIREIYRYQ